MKNNIKILVVDDEAIIRSLLLKMLEREGYNVVTAVDGEEALAIIEESEIDLVISDMKMPKMNGFELLQKIKSNHSELTTIIMTAFGDTYTVKDALLLGADEYITKPFKTYDILLTVERAYWRLISKQNSVSQVSN